jgi:hypothetical protein
MVTFLCPSKAFLWLPNSGSTFWRKGVKSRVVLIGP